MSDEHTDADQPVRPTLRVVRGNPDDVELAALAATLAGISAAGAPAPEPQQPLSMWADRSTNLRHPAGEHALRPGPNAWRASALPL